MRGGRESNLIPLFVLLEFRLPLSGAASKVVTPGRGGREDGVVSAQAQLRASELGAHPSFEKGPISEGLFPHANALAPPPPTHTLPFLLDYVREVDLIHLGPGTLRSSQRGFYQQPGRVLAYVS